MKNIYDFEALDIRQKNVPLKEYKGKAMLIVNTASKCGYTPQYKGLEELYTKFKDKGFIILGFPCNQFGSQEPGDDKEISSFCELNYGVTFPMFAKIDVNGANAHPIYKHLKKEAPGLMGSEAIKWNFTKFLIDKNGSVIKRYGSVTKPQDIDSDIAKLL